MHRIEAYVRLALIFIAVLLVLYLPVLFYLKKRGKSIPRQMGYFGLACSGFLIVFATIFFTPITFQPSAYTLNLIPFAWVGTVDDWDLFLVEKIPNVLLFVPLGFFVPVVFQKMRRLYRTILVAFSVTFCIEFVQFFIGRSSDIDDGLTNLLGAVMGCLIFKLFHHLFRNTKFWRRLLACEE